MKIARIVAGLIVGTFLIVSCNSPLGPGNTTLSQDSTAAVAKLSIKTDSQRSQGVYTNEKGVDFNITSQEDGETIKCVEALEITQISGSATSAVIAKSWAGDKRVKALILGLRADGHPGIWQVHSDDSIDSIEQEESATIKSSKLCESEETGRLVHGLFGWIYYAKKLVGPDSEGGFIVVGYAENKKGFHVGKWSIPPETTVGVYWKVRKKHSWGYRVSKARIIGQPSDKYLSNWADSQKGPHENQARFDLYRLVRNHFSSFKLFFMDWFTSYLAMVDFESKELRYDLDKAAYVVPGIDQEKKPAVANIKLDGTITITQIQPPPPPPSNSYPLVVIDTFHPGAGGYNDTFLTLLDAAGNTLATDDNGNPDQADNLGFSRITYTKGLASGDYYIKINNPEGLGDGYYVIRVLTTDPDSIFPTVAAVDEQTDGDNDLYDNGLPKFPVTIKLGQVISRRLYPVATDVDWFELILPEVVEPPAK